jgi:PAT family beta-lactamase induction signal transducer AmpG
MTSLREKLRSPFAWVPTAYLAEGIPFAMVIWVAGTMFKDLGHTDSEITMSTASIGVMWSLKPLYAGFLDMFKTKRFWVLAMQLVLAVLLGLWATSLALPNYFVVAILLLWLLAFASATQDICIDGVYITSLGASEQGKFMGLQGAFWNAGRIFATAVVVGAAGKLQNNGLDARTAWAIALALSMGAMALLAAYHYWTLPSGSAPERPANALAVVNTFKDQFLDFLKKPHLLGMLTFVLLYRMGEGFLLL